MRFRGFRAFVGGDIERFLKGELTASLKDLFAGLLRLDLVENFNSFEETVEIANGEEILIANRLKQAPSKRIIVRQTGNGLIVDGSSTWNTEQVSLKNEGPNRVKATIIFMR